MGKNFDVPAYKSPINTLEAGECTTYAWGRAYELKGAHHLPKGDAGTWYGSDHGYSKGTTPRKDSIGCFSSHVLYVEDYDDYHDEVVFSEANWYADDRLSNGAWEPEPTGTDGRIKSMTLKEFTERTGGGTYQGCIYLPL